MDNNYVSSIIEEKIGEMYKDGTQIPVNEIEKIIKIIEREIKKINNYKVIQMKKANEMEKSQRLLKYLQERYVFEYQNFKTEQESKKIIKSITDLYFLTEQFFILQGVIEKPRFLMTYNNGKNFIRADFLALLGTTKNDNLSNYLNLQFKDGSWGLRFDSTKVIEKLKQSVKFDKQSEELYKHYKTFINPYIRHEKKSTTGWTMNNGIAREAFERHLENIHMELPEDFKKCNKMDSVGRRWVLYRYSSGSDPYFTGPDTKFSQIKSENASLVSNINTILNTAKFIVEQGKNIDINKLKKLVKQQGENEIKTFSNKIADDMSEKTKNIIKDEFSKFGSKIKFK